jgi:hypothetical protein
MSRYWFRQKTFGYGATPNTWQGWVFTIVGVVLIMGVVLGANYIRDEPLHWIVKIGGFIAVVGAFTWISYLKTEGGWRWRS